MSLPPVEIPLGAMRFNSDSQKLEYWNGGAWMQVIVSESAPIGGRMLVQQGNSSPRTSIDYLNMTTSGDAVDFGDTTKEFYECAACGNKTRGVFAGGTYGTNNNIMEFVTIATNGNAADFGDMAESTNPGGGGGNQTRGILCGGAYPNSNMISFFNMASKGNASDFGVNSPFTGTYSAAMGSPTRTLMFSGRISTPGPGYTTVDDIWFITPQTTGFVNDFGTYQNAQGSDGCFNAAGASSPTRGIIAGGYAGTYPSGANTNQMEFLTISTTGNSVDFGDLTSAQQMSKGAASSIRGFFTKDSPSLLTSGNHAVDSVIFTSLGNAVHFSDLSFQCGSGMSLSNAHGGLV